MDKELKKSYILNVIKEQNLFLLIKFVNIFNYFKSVMVKILL